MPFITWGTVKGEDEEFVFGLVKFKLVIRHSSVDSWVYESGVQRRSQNEDINKRVISI